MAAGAIVSDFVQTAQRRRGWPFVLLIALIPVLIVMTGVTAGGMLREDLHRIAGERGDPAWIPYQLGAEHNRFLLAAETDAPPPELKLRGDVFLSYVDRVREAAQLSEAQKAMMREQLLALDETARRVELLLQGVDAQQGRLRLRDQLRDETPFIREFMLEMSKHYREQVEKEQARKLSALWCYIAAIGVLNIALLILGVLALWFAGRLMDSNRARDEYYVTQNTILASVEEGIIGISHTGAVSYFNARAGEFTGGGLAVGQPMAETWRYRGRLLAQLRSLVADGKLLGESRSPVCRTVQVEDGGQLRHFLLRMSAAEKDAGKGDHGESHVITIRDVTVEVEAAQKRDEYDAHISEASRVLSYAVLAGGIVHEISQPLAAIRNYVHVLRNAPEGRRTSRRERGVAGYLEAEVDRAIEVVRTVRTMGPQERSDPGCCMLSDAVTNSIRLVSLGISPSPNIRITGDDVTGVQVRGSLPMMGQVIINLLKNAIQSSEEAGVSGAMIDMRKQDDFAKISVIDYGRGVSHEAAQRMFLPFVRSSKGGMGLGLAICQRIASSVGGSLTWENRESGGASFTFTIPLAEKGSQPWLPKTS